MSHNHQPQRALRQLAASIMVLTLAAAGGSFVAAEATTTQTERVSVNSTGVQGNGPSGGGSAVSADGRYVAFASGANNLVRGDTNQVRDVFVRDRLTQRTERVSVGNGQQANTASFVTDISADGRYVVFYSSASNLVVRGDNNGRPDVFVRDRRLRTTVRVSKTNNGVGGNAGSAGGVISANGRFVAFASGASNLVPGDTNDASDIFVRDRRRGTTRRVSVTSREAQVRADSSWPTMSATGRFVAFDSRAVNLVRGDANGPRYDVFVRDRRAGTTRRVSIGTDGRQLFESVLSDISPDGRFVVLQAGDIRVNNASILLRDRQTGETRRVSIPISPFGTGNFAASVSENGRFVVYLSSTPLPGEAPDDVSTDALLADLRLGTTRHIALTTSGAKASRVTRPVISADGRWVVFESASNTVVPGDTNRFPDVFIHRR
jgi:Tol biopolymer transport system component